MRRSVKIETPNHSAACFSVRMKVDPGLQLELSAGGDFGNISPFFLVSIDLGLTKSDMAPFVMDA